MNRTAIACTSIVTLGLVAAAIALGPLNPPSGVVTSTNKTLAEIEPRIAINATNTPGNSTALFRITQPGSYYLTGNITGVVGKHGIAIEASGVTLDLNGFDLVGVPGMGSFDGVGTTVVGLTDIAVINGSVRNWGDEGIDLGTFEASSSRVEGVRASGNIGNGFSLGAGCTVSNCTVFQNSISGILTGSGCTVSNCSVYQNTSTGINTAAGCTISNCSTYSNTGSGINTSSGCTISNCTAADNNLTGINTFTGCRVSDCTAYNNSNNGITVNIGSMVVGCTSRANTLDGIQCSSQCVIRGNTCSANGNSGDGAGIHAGSSDNRIEGNNCTGADRGIDVDLAGNVIIRNTCSGNTTNWVIAANNVVGPILDRTAPGSAAISGNTAPDSTGSAHPNANFTY